MSSGTYRIEAGKLREDLACMIANFKQVITNQEILASGALVYIEVEDVIRWEEVLEVSLPTSDYERCLVQTA